MSCSLPDATVWAPQGCDQCGQSGYKGRVGVFEAIVMGLIVVHIDGRIAAPVLAASVAASLLIYRIIYYLLPLCAAIALSGIAELIRARGTASAMMKFAPIPARTRSTSST